MVRLERNRDQKVPGSGHWWGVARVTVGLAFL